MSSQAGQPSKRERFARLDESRRGGMASVGDAMSQYLTLSGIGAKLGDFRVFEAWKVAIGEESSRRARAVSFRRGELTVEVESAALLQELKSFTGETLRARANDHLGADRIRRVNFKLKR